MSHQAIVYHIKAYHITCHIVIHVDLTRISPIICSEEQTLWFAKQEICCQRDETRCCFEIIVGEIVIKSPCKWWDFVASSFCGVASSAMPVRGTWKGDAGKEAFNKCNWCNQVKHSYHDFCAALFMWYSCVVMDAHALRAVCPAGGVEGGRCEAKRCGRGGGIACAWGIC